MPSRNFVTVPEIESHIGTNHPKADTKAWPPLNCQKCGSPLDWVRPIADGFRLNISNDPESLRIDLESGSTIEESVEVNRLENYIKEHARLIREYQGSDLVKKILESENDVKEAQERLIHEIASIR